MAQVARDEFAALVDETLLAVHAADVPNEIDREAVKALQVRLVHVMALATDERLVRVGNVARHLQRLLTAIEAEEPSERHAATVRRGLDVLAILAQDAERQRRGEPAAALDDAVDCFVEQVERAVRGERGARIMRFPQSRTRRNQADLPGSWPTPPGSN
jgi:hypothetical protein